MRIQTSLSPHFHRPSTAVQVAVVIDVLRATSVIVTALAAGALRVITCREIDQARQLAAGQQPAGRLCGERGCQPIDGFHFGNSPAEYLADQVGGQSLVLTTTNGTAAIAAASGAESLLIASFLNLTAVVDRLRGCTEVHLVCSGTDGQITAEDVLLAGAIVARCEDLNLVHDCCDASVISRQLWQSWLGRSAASVTPQDLAERLRQTQGGRNLIRLGYQQDLHRCAAIDSLAVVPQLVSRNPATFQL